MSLCIMGFFSPVDLSLDAALEKFYTFIEECKTTSSLFSGMYFSAGSLKKALQRPLPDANKSEFISELHKQLDTNKVLNEVISSFRVWKNMEGYGGYISKPSKKYDVFMSIDFVHCTVNRCAIVITFAHIGRSGAEKSKNLVNTVCAAIIHNFPILYMTEDFQIGDMAWHEHRLNISWAIYAPTKDIGHIKNFPTYEIVPGFTRIASVEELFDAQNPNHVEKARELEKNIASNSQFVERVGFKSQYAC